MDLIFRIRSHQRRQEGCSDSTVPESPDIKQIFFLIFAGNQYVVVLDIY